MINYIIQVLLFQAVFLAIYDFFLQKETFFKWNRFYLLVTPFLSFIIPLLKFQSIQKQIPEEYIFNLPTVVLNPQTIIEESSKSISTFNYINIVFYIGVFLFLMVFLVRLFKIIHLIKSNKVVKNEDYNIVLLDQHQSAFSFFNYIFINKKYVEKDDLQIIKHELVHCKQYHTVDLLLFEILKIILWFNPFIYVFQKRITLLHEYISDAEIVKDNDKSSYFNKLLSETFNVENISFINQFYKQSLIKKRIVMITKNKSQKIKQLKYLLLVPVLLSMLVYASCSDAEKDELLEIENVLNKTTEGNYVDTKKGKIYVGKSLVGEVVPYENYTNKEKEMHSKFSQIENSIFEYFVVIDKNGERINFFKTNSKADDYKNNWQYVEGENVPFAVIENVPVFPDCEGTEEELRKCLQEKITAHVANNFNSKIADNLGLEEGLKRIFVMFTINKDGNISEVKSRAPHKALEEEAIRVVTSLPKMKPGKYSGKNVGVKYSLPIAFKVEGNKNDNKALKNLPMVDGVLYVLNGEEISKEDLNKVDPKTIKEVKVLKNEKATEKYGEKGKNGVIELYLK